MAINVSRYLVFKKKKKRYGSGLPSWLLNFSFPVDMV